MENMDPNKCLEGLRILASQGYKATELEAQYNYIEMCDKFIALDNWIKTGGFYPDAWLEEAGSKIWTNTSFI